MGTLSKRMYCHGLCYLDKSERTIIIEYISAPGTHSKGKYNKNRNLCEDYSECENKEDCPIYASAKKYALESEVDFPII